MNPLTNQLLKRLWEGDPSFTTIAVRLKNECKSLSPAEAAVIGRDLILRRRALFTRDFNLAAYLSSDGTAGNDGFMDFTDCVALLPSDRYQRVLANPDELIDDPVSSGFDELYLVSEVSSVFDKAMFEEEDDGGFLDYLILGDDPIDWSTIHGGTKEYARTRLPRLHAKFGYLMEDSDPDARPPSDSVTLDAFFDTSSLPKSNN